MMWPSWKTLSKTNRDLIRKMRPIANPDLKMKTVLLCAFATLLFAAASCSRQGASTKPADVDYYTCPMHPSVKKQSPKDKCPICSMDLTPVKKKDVPRPGASMPEPPSTPHSSYAHSAPHSDASATNTEERPTEFTVPVARQQQIGVTYATIENKPL